MSGDTGFADLILETAAEGALVLDTSLKILYLNPAARRLLALTGTDGSTPTLPEVFPQLASSFYDACRRALSEQTSVTAQVVERLEARIIPLHPSPEKPKPALLLHLRQMDSHERESEQYRLLANAMPQLVWTADSEGMLDYYNDRVFEYGGVVQSENAAWNWQPILHPEDAEATMAAWREAAQEGKPYQFEHRLQMADGSYRWHLSRALLTRDDTGRVLKWFGTATDIHDRKEAEQALDRFFTLSPDLLAVASFQDGFWQRVNPALCRTLGYSEEEMLAMPFLEIVHPDDLPRSRDALLNLTEGIPLKNFEHRVLCKDRSYRWISWETTPVVEEGLLYCAGRDITERRRAEEALRRSEEQLRLSEERFHTLADNIAQFAWMADENGWTFWYNQRWFDYTGTTLEEMQGWGWQAVHHPEHVARVVKKIAECFRTGQFWEDTFPLRGADGNYRWFLSRAVPIRDESGKVVRWFGTNTDITELRATQEALEKSERRFRVLADTAPAMLWVTDASGYCTFLSRGWYEFTGQTEETALGYGWLEATHPEDRKRSEDAFTIANRKHEPFALDHRVRRRDGVYRWVIDTGRPRWSDRGDFLGYIGSVIDIHDRKQAEAERDELLAQQSHIARTLQDSLLLAPAPDAYPGLLVVPQYRSAHDDALIGGDFFDVFAVEANQIALVVGDAVGKGVEAATYTAELKFALRAFLRTHDSPSQALMHLNTFVTQNARLDAAHVRNAFTALSVVVLDTESGAVRVAAAGAEPPFVLRAATGEVKILTGGSPLLGMVDNVSYEEGTDTLETGDLLVMTTDGITEARRKDPEEGWRFFGYNGMVNAVRARADCPSLQEIGHDLIERATAYANGLQHDDICLLLARFTPPAEPV